MSKNTFQRILLPGFLFQSVIIGGGYATGRELVEFFLSNGPMAGLLGMVVAALAFSVIAAVSFELARMTRSYDYRTFSSNSSAEPGFCLKSHISTLRSLCSQLSAQHRATLSQIILGPDLERAQSASCY